MPLPSPSVEELVAVLRRSSLPTVLVEGKDDMRIFRWIEDRLGSQTANILPTGGRETLLCVYKKRGDFAGLPVAFVADRDMWLFSGIPSHYEEIIWTEGYSIENDLYAGAELENLLDSEEAREHRQLLEIIVEWFAFEVERHLAGEDFEVAHHCNRIVPPGRKEMDEAFRNSRGFRPPDTEIHQQIRKEYHLQLRGKQLFQVLVRFLSASDRSIKHSSAGLCEIAFKICPSHPLMNRLMLEIERTIAEQDSASDQPDLSP
ncbi:MAG: DUF4435 domain-containing protein [Caldilineaceae bacterium]|nr:DUF4435 domain-containing protein [Caldilineaceae bacterium]